MRQGVLAAAMLVATTGCFTWTEVGALPRTANLPPDVRITKFDSTQVILATSRIESDTIKGFQVGSTERVIIPLAHVDLIERRKLQVKQTVVATTVATAGFLVLVNLLAQSDPLGPIPTPP